MPASLAMLPRKMLPAPMTMDTCTPMSVTSRISSAMRLTMAKS